MPKFCENLLCNPIEFLDEVDRFFRFKGVREEQKLVLIEHMLTGRARIWYTIHRRDLFNYIDFKEAFKTEFYSVPVQVGIRNKWRDKRYRLSDGSLLLYFYQQVKASQHIEPIMSSYEVNYSIVQQLPSRIREILSVVDYSNTHIIAQALEQLDANREIDKEVDKPRTVWGRNRVEERSIRSVNRLHVHSGNNSPERRTYGSNVYRSHGNRGLDLENKR